LRDPVKKAEYESAKQVEAIKQQFEGVINAQNEKIGMLTENVSTLTESVKSLLQALAPKKGKE
jgi:glycine cleavage system H lipoate-binding protein